MSASLAQPPRPIDWSQVFLGGLLIAAGDIAFATTVWFTWDAAGITRVFQSIAVGVLGKASFEGGVPTAVLGAALHLFMATMFVVACTLVARRAPALLRKPFVYGPPYGVLLYLIMNFVVMPLSRVGASPSFKHLDTIALSVVAHMLFGTICMLFAQRALRRA
ncbi:hypothetical protein [Dokdonella sp.]|uniref:hypothetical protein n=1 Tax=Dokdonella sp. TaxID=2291710 RepID=UPI0037848289